MKYLFIIAMEKEASDIIVCETEIKIDYQKYDNLMIYKTRKYGSKEVTILKKV